MAIKLRTWRAALLAGCATSALVTAMPAGAAAEGPPRQYEITSQDLGQALRVFAMTSGHDVVFDPGLVKGRTTAGVTGAVSDEGALRELLKGTNLAFEQTPSGGFVVRAPRFQASANEGGGAEVEALIVTAQKREEDIQDVPIAISAFSQEDLTRSQIAGGPDLMTQVPNMTFTKTNFSGYSIQIRGIGTQAISATTDPAVAVAFNNTPFIRNRFFEQEFYDLQRVEVLRGPQGTLYGRNATAGVVNIISAKPKYNFEAKASADLGNFSSSRLEGMINMPLVEDKAALRIAGAWTKRAGYVTNILTGEQTDGRDLWSTRVSLRLTPTDRFDANLIYEHFEEHDDRLRSGKQLCDKDPGPSEIGGVEVPQSGYALVVQFSQGCKPASAYSPDSFDTPNGYALPYYGPVGAIGAPVYQELDPYANSTQSRNLREIETHIEPEYEANSDMIELQMQFDLTPNLTLSSETGFNRDHIFSYEDYNRFDTTPGVFIPGRNINRFDIIDEDGVFCDPQLGCTNRLALGDLSTAESQQFSQEFRLSSDFEGPINFNVGANFLRYDTEEKYYVFINSLTAYLAGTAGTWDPTDVWPGDNSYCYDTRNTQNFDLVGYVWSSIDAAHPVAGCSYIDPNDIHNLNDNGRNYFLSKNPYHLLSYAAFGEVYWQIADNLKVTGGFRWTVDRKTAPQIPSWLLANLSYGTPTRKTLDLEWSEPTGRMAIDWQPDLGFTDETLVYLSYVRGYKAGGANPPPAVPVFGPVGICDTCAERIVGHSLAHPETFDAEFVNAFEVGTKNTLFDGGLTFNLSAFYYDYTGYQISQIVDRSAINLNFDAAVWGAELEVAWRPIENLGLGFKGGYENTQLADGSAAIDLMDRTAGHEGWVVVRPFPTFPSNCIAPEWLVSYNGELHGACEGYITNTDPATGLPYEPFPQVDFSGYPVSAHWGDDYPGYDPSTAPNNGEGFLKDLSGNKLPNAPKFTGTVTADYTIPLPAEWLVTLHGDFYYQSEAWTRVFNTPGYDKLKAYSNINLAAIFSNEDAGWTVMAYVKNVLDKDNITGAFLNSDDTGLTTNVFLNEPRLYGLRVTKEWNGAAWWSNRANTSGYYPYRLELDGEYGRVGGGHEVLAPDTAALFPAEHPYPLGVQDDLDWAHSGGVKFTYQPRPGSWALSGGIRYGRAGGSAEGHTAWELPGGLKVTQEKYEIFKETFPPSLIAQLYLDPTENGWYNYATTTAENKETHAIADFMMGKDVGLGSMGLPATSSLSFGLRYTHFNSDSSTEMHGRPDLTFPAEDIIGLGGEMHRFHATMDTHRQFDGAGPAVDWSATIPLLGDPAQSSGIGLDVGVGGSVLWGLQKARVAGEVREEHWTQLLSSAGEIGDSVTTSLTADRSTRVTVPGANANLGLSYTAGGLKVSGGYRIERYFDAIDGGIAERKTYDRQFDGPYFKISVGFGG